MTSHSDQGEFGFQIAPMLDVLFVLLLFFMVSAGVQKKEALLKTQLPGEGSSTVPINLDISEDGQVIFNGAPTDSPTDHQLPETTARLKAAMADSPEHPVIVRPSLKARHQRVMDVLNMCEGLHVPKLAFGNPSE